MRSYSPIIIGWISLMFFVVPPAGAKGQPAELVSAGTGAVLISLGDAVAAALRNNLGLIARRFDVDAARQRVEVERAAFDPTVDAEANWREVDRQAAVIERLLPPFDPTLSLDPRERHVRVAVGAQSLLPAGTLLRGEVVQRYAGGNRLDELAAASGLYDIADYQSEYVLVMSQPLLRNAGRGANLARTRIAVLGAEQSEDDFRAAVLDTVAAVEEAYWRLALYEDELLNAENSLALAEDLLRRNINKVEAGVLDPLERDIAEAEVAARRERLIVLRLTLHNGRDDLLRLMGVPEDDALWELGVTPDRQPVLAGHPTLRFDDVYAAALVHRPDLARAEKQVEAAAVELRYAANQRLPSLSVSAGATLSGNERSDQWDANSTALGGDYIDYSVGARFDYPLNNRAAEARHRAALARHQQALAQRDDLLQRVRVELCQALRDVRAAEEGILAASETIEAQTKRLRKEQEAYEVGISDSRDVLEAQQDLVDAQTRQSLAVVSYRHTLVRLEQRTGTLLRSHRVLLAPAPAEDAASLRRDE